MRTTQIQISLRIRTISSEQLISVHTCIIEPITSPRQYEKILLTTAKADQTVHVPSLSHLPEDTFSPGTIQTDWEILWPFSDRAV